MDAKYNNSSPTLNSVIGFYKKYFELTLIAVFSLLWLALVFQGFPVITLDWHSLEFVFDHYLFPLVAACIIQIIITFAAWLQNKTSYTIKSKEIQITLLYFPLIIVVVFLHFNFKAWTPLVNPVTYDLLYNNIDSMFPFTGWLKSIGGYLDINNSAPYLYHKLFVLMFAFSFIIHSTFDTFLNFRKVVVGTCLILLFGAVSYWIMPAIGEFVLETPELEGFYVYQNHMYTLYASFLQTGLVPIGYFTNAPAAMPSLHIANSFFLLVLAKRTIPYLAILYIFLFTYFVIIAVASGWHYLIDLIFGLILSLAALFIVDKVFSAQNINV